MKTKWASPFIVGQHGSAKECVTRYMEHVRPTAITPRYISRNFRRVRAEARDSLDMLSGHPELMMEVMMQAL